MRLLFNSEGKEHESDKLSRDVIELLHNQWSSAIHLTGKKDGLTRFCIYYRRLNRTTLRDSYILPRIDEVFISGSVNQK